MNPFQSTVQATITKLTPVEIHGNRFDQVEYTTDDEPTRPQAARLASEAFYQGAAVGDRIEVESLMGIVLRIGRTDG